MNNMTKAILGYNIWVLAEGSHGHQGHPTAGRIYWGSAMHPDGKADLTRLTAYVVTPQGKKVPASLRKGERDFHLAVFIPEQEGLWILSVENDVGPLVITSNGLYQSGTRKEYPNARKAAYYYQFAKTYIPVGHLHHAQESHRHGHHHCGHCYQEHSHVGYAQEIMVLGHQLEIIATPIFCQVGDEAIIEVRYKGLPLAEKRVFATWSLYPEKNYPVQAKTGADGRVKIPLRQAGHWLFYVQHEESDANEYEEKIYSATYTIFGVR